MIDDEKLINSETREYKTFCGKILIFDISDGACLKFGFKADTKIHTPVGRATVIGVHVGSTNCDCSICTNSRFVKQLWFHVDDDPGASYWSNCECPEDFEAAGFRELNKD